MSRNFFFFQVFDVFEAMAELASDAELILRVKAGDREAFNVLVQRYRKPLINFIYRFTTNPAESEDLAQEVFLRAFQAAPKYQPMASFATWLYRIATNLTLNYLRDHRPHLSRPIDRNSDHQDEELPFAIEDSRALIEDQLIEQERTVSIRQALADLPENQRLAVILTKYQDLSIKEAAAVLKCSETAVKSLIFRAYKSLRQRLVFVVGAGRLE